MNYSEALKLVKTEFETRRDCGHCEIIRTNLTYDGCNGFCVVIYDKGSHVILSDMGETKEIFDEVTEEEWKELCASHGFEFNHWHIEKVLNSLDDVYDYINFIDFISDKFFLLDDD